MDALKTIGLVVLSLAVCVGLLWWIGKRHPNPPKSDSEFDDRQY